MPATVGRYILKGKAPATVRDRYITTRAKP
jgi:hypothetical protein